MLEIKAVRMEFPEDANIIVGQSHFIKTVEDLYVAQSKQGRGVLGVIDGCSTKA